MSALGRERDAPVAPSERVAAPVAPSERVAAPTAPSERVAAPTAPSERVAAPTAPSERVAALDALRGAALLGVLVVNALTAFRVGAFERFAPAAHGGPGAPGSHAARAAAGALDAAIARAVSLGVESKAFILFSLLFGVGLAVQHERARARGGSFATYAARRLGALLAIGLVHLYLVWDGDVLALYAIVGVVAAACLRLPTRALAALSLLLFAVAVAPLPWPRPFATPEALAAHVDAARHVYPNGGFADVLAFRVREVAPMTALLVWSAPRTLALFLLGACAWRSRILLPPRRRGRFVALAAGFIPAGLALVWAATSSSGAHALARGPWGAVAAGWGAVILALGYGALVVATLDVPVLGRALASVAPLGRMALTSYLTQSIVLGFVFYGYGLGLFGRLGEAAALGVAVVLYVAQAIASALWLRRYRFGPVEWAWRSFTYGALQPMRAARAIHGDRSAA
jgi:uncharacterized protein